MEGRHDARPARYFRPGEIPIPTPAAAEWKVTVSDGPVIATAIHDGHALRPSLQRLSDLDSAVRWREEDPLTSVFTAVGDVRLQAGTSRFEVDLNRPRDGAVYARPEDAWGLELWRAPLPDAELEQSLAQMILQQKQIEEQEALLRKFAELRGEDQSPGRFSPGHGGFFSKIRDAFGSK